MNRWVSIGCSSGHDYSSLLPFACLMWRERIGYTPIIFLVGTKDSWAACKHGTLVPSIIEDLGFHINWIDSIDGVDDGTVAQSIRLHAAAMDLPAGDILIPSDADLLPVRKEFYYQHDINQFPIGSYYWNGYGEEAGSHFPTCHVSARVETWREFMKLNGSGVRGSVIEQFDHFGLKEKIAAHKADPQKNWMGVWFADEHNLSARLMESRFYPAGIQKILRDGQPPKDRLDRSCWPASYDAINYSDCHSIRPAWSHENWPRLQPLIAQALPKYLAWADVFITEFRRRMES